MSSKPRRHCKRQRRPIRTLDQIQTRSVVKTNSKSANGENSQNDSNVDYQNQSKVVNDVVMLLEEIHELRQEKNNLTMQIKELHSQFNQTVDVMQDSNLQ